MREKELSNILIGDNCSSLTWSLH